LFSIEFEGKVE